MKWAISLLCCLSVAAAAELSGGRTVYLMPMGHSLDQFLADRLTRMHVLQVVTDPAKADTVITDRVGASLQTRLKELYPPPPAPAPVKPQPTVEAKEAAKEGAKTNTDTSKSSGDTISASSGPLAGFGDTSNKVADAGSMATSGHGRGTIFLVDVKSSQVLWSIFETPKNSSPRALDRSAERIVKRLKEDLAGK